MKLRHFLAISILTKIDPPQKNIVKTIFTKTTYFSGMALPPDIFRDSLVTVSLFHMEKKLFCLKSLIKFSVYIRWMHGCLTDAQTTMKIIIILMQLILMNFSEWKIFWNPTPLPKTPETIHAFNINARVLKICPSYNFPTPFPTVIGTSFFFRKSS